ncbi:MAG: CoB--CoM heterodisulfide reductase iron-sulfur subunit A family protein [Bacteroidales bacterium]|nr:CoB--CoM heterodisulfide reductase iron-sulfur subunit A family protein [Bacteroidales bacterium]
MNYSDNVGVVFVNEGAENNGFNFNELKEYARKLNKVTSIWDIQEILQKGKKWIISEIKEKNINKLVIAGIEPGFYKTFLANVMLECGNNPEKVYLASFSEYAATTKNDIDKAKTIIACAVYNADYEKIVDFGENSVNTNTLVIGGGIAGIQASLEIAASKNKVYLVEKSGTIGGHMAMFDKTFPTLDCAACILTPKMVEVGQNPYIELMTYSEVLEVNGEPGNYQVKILKKARRVDLAKCIGCGQCAEKCPTRTPSEFDAGTKLRKAIYIPFPQAVPNKYLIDEKVCTYVQTGKCGICVKFCPVPGCINLDEKDKIVEITVGNIIVAIGYKVFDARKIEQYGYGKYPEVITSLELERLINASGPTGGKIARRVQDKKGFWIFSPDEIYEPKSIAIIHCIGSRDENYNKYCSKVCCMYSLKLAHLLKEKLHDSEVTEYYIDMRAFGKGYEEFYNRIKNEGVNIVRGKAAKVEKIGNDLIVRAEDIENGKIIEQKVDLVVLAVGLEASEDAKKIAQILGISVDENGFFNEFNNISEPVDTHKGGIYVAGLCQGPKDIPDSVAQASAAAARVLQSIAKQKINNRKQNFSISEVEAKIFNA